jgi:LmbE family N-acetylglucosaminyl deacetylase
MAQEGDWTPERVLCVCAHPDDPEFGFGGTVAKLCSRGAEVTYVICTDGAQGGEDPALDNAELTERRYQEQRAAASVLGVREVRFLGLRDGELVCDLDLRRRLVREIREVRPQLVLTQSPVRALRSGRIGSDHPDHLAVGEATLAAVYPDARNPRAFRDLLVEGWTPHRVEEIWVGGAIEADLAVDVTSFVDLKLRALACHVSQLDKPHRTWDQIQSFVRAGLEERGRTAGYPYAEAFRRLDVR